jgi:RHS repeat-associated protein
VQNIGYHYLELPETITVGFGADIALVENGYDDEAHRLYKKNEGRLVSQYIYGLDGQALAEYDGNNDLKMWSLGGFGYKTGEDTDVDSYYYIKDHIGNIRVTINEGGNIMGKDDYYPFGLRMAGFSYNRGMPESHLKFSGKELDEEQGLKKYHFGWRDYNPELARWNVVDPARQYASPYVYGGNNPIIGYDEDGRWFLIDDLIASAIGFTISYVSTGLTTDNWGKEAIVNGLVGAGAAWVGWNTGGATLAMGKNLSFGATVGYGTTSGAFSGLTYGGLKYTADAAYDGSTYSLNNLNKNWNFNDFMDNASKGSINGAITGGAIAGTLYGAEFAAKELGWLDKKYYIEEGMKVKVDSKQFPEGTIFTNAENAKSLKTLGFPIKSELKHLGNKFTFGHNFTKVNYYFTAKDVLYNSNGILGHAVNQSIHTLVHSGMILSNDSKLFNYIIDDLYNSFKAKYVDDQKRVHWWHDYFGKIKF